MSPSCDPRGPHQRTENTTQINRFFKQGFTHVKSGCRGPKFARQSINCILGPHPRPRRPCPPAVTPGAPIRRPEGRKTPPKLTVFHLKCFTLLKSGHRGPKFVRQSINRILGSHPHPRRPSPPAMTPGVPIRPPKGRETSPKSIVFPWQGFTQLVKS